MSSSAEKMKICLPVCIAAIIFVANTAPARLGFLRGTSEVDEEDYYGGTLTPRAKRTSKYNAYELMEAFTALKEEKLLDMGLIESVSAGQKRILDMERIRRQLARDPNNINLLSMAVNQSLASGQAVKAFAYSQRLLEVDSKSIGNWMLYGKASLAAGMFEEARDACLKILQIDPDNLMAKSYKACLDLIDGAEAEDVLAELQPLDVGELAKVLNWLANDSELLRGILGRDGYLTLCAIVFAEDEVTLKTQPFLKGDMDADATTELLKKVAEGLKSLFSYNQTGDWQAAQDKVRELREMGFNPPALQKEMALYLFKGGAVEEGLEQAEKLRRRYTGWRGIDVLYASLLYDSDRKAEGIRIISQAYKENPNDFTTIMQYGIILLDFGDYEAARDVLAHASAVYKGNSRVAFLLACAYAKTGDVERGLEMMKKLAQGNPAIVRNMLKDNFNFLDWIPDELRSQFKTNTVEDTSIHRP